MALRPVFIPDFSGYPYFKSVNVEFQWFSGFSRTQAMRTIDSLHEAAERQGIFPVLEISSKSASALGVSLSAFDLSLTTSEREAMSVECAYQGSKVFENGGPYHDLYAVSSREAKSDPRLRNSGEVISFEFLGQSFPIEPQTAFYNWLYITALSQKDPPVAQELKQFKGFSDIAFNPKRSINCQARAVAVFVALNQSVPDEMPHLANWDSHMEILTGAKKLSPVEPALRQLGLPLEDVRDPHPPPVSKSKRE